jgi:hypothetical protein
MRDLSPGCLVSENPCLGPAIKPVAWPNVKYEEAHIDPGGLSWAAAGNYPELY